MWISNNRRRVFLPVSSGFDADYQALIDEADSNGHALPSSSQQILQNQLVIDLKASGVWSKLDLLYIFANDAGIQFTYYNWIDPSNFKLTPYYGIDWTKISNDSIYHIGFNALNTGYKASRDAVNFQLTNGSVGLKKGTVVNTYGTDQGAYRAGIDGVTQTLPAWWLYEGNFQCRNWNNIGGSSVSFGNSYRYISNTSNCYINVGQNGNTQYLFKNGVLQTSISNTPTGLFDYDIYIHWAKSRNDFKYFYLGSYLSASEQAALESAFQTYFSNL